MENSVQKASKLGLEVREVEVVVVDCHPDISLDTRQRTPIMIRRPLSPPIVSPHQALSFHPVFSGVGGEREVSPGAGNVTCVAGPVAFIPGLGRGVQINCGVRAVCAIRGMLSGEEEVLVVDWQVRTLMSKFWISKRIVPV